MKSQKVRACFTINFTDEQYDHARYYVEDMRQHPNRVFWLGKEGKSDEELIIEQIAHRILSGFYNKEPFLAGKYIMRMDSTLNMWSDPVEHFFDQAVDRGRRVRTEFIANPVCQYRVHAKDLVL